MDCIKDFENYKYDNTISLFTNINMMVRVVDIYDGDTCTVVIKLHDTYYKHSVRLCGIDTCEMKSKDAINKQNAILARNRLYSMVTNTKLDDIKYTRNEIRKLLNNNVYMCYLKIQCLDKYGRFLGNLYTNDKSTENFSDIMIKEHLAYKYDGGTKQEGIIEL